MRNDFKCPKDVWQSFTNAEKEAYNRYYDYIYAVALELEVGALDHGLEAGSQRRKREVAYKLRVMSHAMAKLAATMTTDTLSVYDKS